jgi:hypothetical protein
MHHAVQTFAGVKEELNGNTDASTTSPLEGGGENP